MTFGSLLRDLAHHLGDQDMGACLAALVIRGWLAWEAGDEPGPWAQWGQA